MTHVIDRIIRKNWSVFHGKEEPAFASKAEKVI
jgi:hypothetical protein